MFKTAFHLGREKSKALICFADKMTPSSKESNIDVENGAVVVVSMLDVLKS